MKISKSNIIYLPPPLTKEYEKILKMLDQTEVWMNSGESELASEHWKLISKEAEKYSEKYKLNENQRDNY